MTHRTRADPLRRRFSEAPVFAAWKNRLGRRDFLRRVAALLGAPGLTWDLVGSAGLLAGASQSARAGGLDGGGHAASESTRPPPKQDTQETLRLAEYAAAVHYDNLPPAVVQRAKDCITDTVATIIQGADLPSSRIIIAYARRYGTPGNSWILGAGGPPLHAPAAALANGALAHAFELDNLTRPDSGSHPGATLFCPALAVAQERGLGGRELIAAFVAGAEVMIRIGRATKHSNEARGFHAPGTTGPFGAAVAVCRLIGLDATATTNALGIAGSLAAGLLEFAHSGNGAMVKRLHLGRAAESGVLAASLAADGFTGPSTVLEGKFGFLRVFCNEWDQAELTQGLGEIYLTQTILMKRFACHITAHAPVEAVFDLQKEQRFAGSQVAAIQVVGNARMATINNIPRPADLLMAQYSIPFCVALALFRDPRDPQSFDDAALRDPEIASLAERVSMSVADGQSPLNLASTVTVTLSNGQVLTRRIVDFKGTPERPFDTDELRAKFLLLTRRADAGKMQEMFTRLQNIEHERDLSWLKL